MAPEAASADGAESSGAAGAQSAGASAGGDSPGEAAAADAEGPEAAGTASTAGAGTAGAGVGERVERAVRFEAPPSPGDAPMAQAPELPAAAEEEAVPSKPMPRPPPAKMLPNPYRDFRLGPPAVGPSPELVASIDRQLAAEREARIAAAWSEQTARPKASPVPTAEALEAFIAWQARQAEAQAAKGKGKGKQMAAPAPFPQAWGTKGKGKASGGDPFLPMTHLGRGASRERRRDSAKRTRHDRDAAAQDDDGPRPRPCRECGSWYVCRTAPENVARGATHGHCSNPECERSFGRRNGQDMPVRDRPTAPDVFGPKAPPAAAAAPRARRWCARPQDA